MLKISHATDFIFPHSDVAKMLFLSPYFGIREVILSGGRSLGKSKLVWFYIDQLCRRIRKFQVGVSRSTYSTIRGTTLKTMEAQYEYGWHPKRNPFRLSGGPLRPDVLEWWNRSQVHFFGLQDKDKRKGLELNLTWLNEGQEVLDPYAYTDLGGALIAGRGGGWYVEGRPFSQRIIDCNPATPFHWLYKQKFDKGLPNETYLEKLQRVSESGIPLWLEVFLEDNPAYTDGAGGLNRLGEQAYQEIYDTYKHDPFELQRMLHGEWIANAGLVFSMYVPEVHIEKMVRGQFQDETTDWYMAIDHGGTVPFAVLLVAKVGQKFNVFKELCMRNCTLDAVITACDALLERYQVSKSQIKAMFADTNVPGFNKSLRQAGYPVREAKKDIVACIDSVKSIIGNNLFAINANSLESRDPTYSHPQGLKEEFTVYAYHPESVQETMINPLLPIDKHNHFCDAFGYLVSGVVRGIKLPAMFQSF